MHRDVFSRSSRMQARKISLARRGAAVVEMAIVTPLLLIFAFGTLEATTAIHLQQSLEIAAYEGARVALLPDTDVGNVQAACDQLLASRRVKNATVSVTPTNYQGAPYGAEIEVEVTATLAQNSVVPLLVLRSRRLTATVVMMKEQ